MYGVWSIFPKLTLDSPLAEVNVKLLNMIHRRLSAHENQKYYTNQHRTKSIIRIMVFSFLNNNKSSGNLQQCTLHMQQDGEG